MLRKGLIYLGMALVLVSQPVLSQDQGILQINPVPSRGLEFNDNTLYRAHIDELNGLGIIQRAADDLIVIDDCGFKPAAHVQYFNLEGLPTTSYYFRVGQRAGYVLNDRKEIESLWEVEEVK